MSKRINIGVSDGYYEWLALRAKENGLSVSSYATMLLAQAKKNIENTEVMQAYMKQFASLPSEVLASELAKIAGDENKKDEKGD